MSKVYNHSECSGNKRVDWVAFLFSKLLIHSMALSQIGHVAFDLSFYLLKIPNDTFYKTQAILIGCSIKSSAS